FGERMCEGVKMLFAQGFDQLIVIGNDCPGLETADLLRAKEKLDKDQHIIGYDQAGGAYLFGLCKKDFDEKAFQNLPWRSQKLGKALAELLATSREIVELESKEDIDTVKDLLWLILSLKVSQLLLLLRKLFLQILTQAKELPLHYSRLLGPEQALRAPPLPIL
ncbi:MAG: DUF2064 domain-containing protein, partial [Bacteroidota bacterium]